MSLWIADGSIGLVEVEGTKREVFNSVSGVPNYTVQVACPFASRKDALKKLLGNPEKWPHDTIFPYVYCIAADVVSDGEYTTDADEQILHSTNSILQLTYAPRNGVYISEDYFNKPVYWLDEIEPRYESRPVPHRNFFWGNTDTSIPTEKMPLLDGDEAPQKSEAGVSLVHTIEGWQEYAYYDLMLASCGTTNSAAYTSPILGKTFAAGTLLLRNATIVPSYTHVSYKLGVKTYTVKLFYEWKANGWQKFWRNYGPSPDYYYIRHNTSPYAVYNPFPMQSHSTWMTYHTLAP